MLKKTLALILAAGKGSRLKASCPKPLYPIDNKPSSLIFESLIQSIGER